MEPQSKYQTVEAAISELLQEYSNTPETVVVKLDHQIFEESFGTIKNPLNYLSVSYISNQFTDCMFFMPDSIVMGRLEVGATVLILETPCPMDNCNAPEAHGFTGQVVWVGQGDELLKIWESKPNHKVWFWLQ